MLLLSLDVVGTRGDLWSVDEKNRTRTWLGRVDTMIALVGDAIDVGHKRRNRRETKKCPDQQGRKSRLNENIINKNSSVTR